MNFKIRNQIPELREYLLDYWCLEDSKNWFDFIDQFARDHKARRIPSVVSGKYDQLVPTLEVEDNSISKLRFNCNEKFLQSIACSHQWWHISSIFLDYDIHQIHQYDQPMILTFGRYAAYYDLHALYDFMDAITKGRQYLNEYIHSEMFGSCFSSTPEFFTEQEQLKVIKPPVDEQNIEMMMDGLTSRTTMRKIRLYTNNLTSDTVFTGVYRELDLAMNPDNMVESVHG